MKARGFKILILGLVVLVVFSFAIMLLWNWLIPPIFGLITINFWQALGLFALARILLGGFNGSRMMMGGMSRNHRNAIHEKWTNMTEEQRREFIRKRHAFGFGNPFRSSDSEKQDE